MMYFSKKYFHRAPKYLPLQISYKKWIFNTMTDICVNCNVQQQLSYAFSSLTYIAYTILRNVDILNFISQFLPTIDDHLFKLLIIKENPCFQMA